MPVNDKTPSAALTSEYDSQLVLKSRSTLDSFSQLASNIEEWGFFFPPHREEKSLSGCSECENAGYSSQIYPRSRDYIEHSVCSVQ